MENFTVRDARNKEKFVIDDKYLNGFARICGWKATIVYISLCRHADKTQKSFPSIKLLAQEHNVSPRTIIRGIKILLDNHLIVLEKSRNEDGKFLRNTYILLDKIHWRENSQKNTQVTVSHMDNQVTVSHMDRGYSQVTVSHTKDTHKEKDTHIGNNFRENSQKKQKQEPPWKTKKYLLALPVEDVSYFCSAFPKLTAEEIKKEAEKCYHHWEARGKSWKNHKSLLRNWLSNVSDWKKPTTETFTMIRE